MKPLAIRMATQSRGHGTRRARLVALASRLNKTHLLSDGTERRRKPVSSSPNGWRQHTDDAVQRSPGSPQLPPQTIRCELFLSRSEVYSHTFPCMPQIPSELGLHQVESTEQG